jgi:hypothetical protein
LIADVASGRLIPMDVCTRSAPIEPRGISRAVGFAQVKEEAEGRGTRSKIRCPTDESATVAWNLHHAGVIAEPVLPPQPEAPPQRVVKIRRDYNNWVASETMEDYALRYTPQRFRKWSEWRVANTAFGAASFLVLEAVGATLLVQYGFVNAFWAILVTGLVIFLAGLPISVYASRYGVDMDLLTRGAGFGYIGSTITSLIYASFTFIFFALEAAIMAYALELALDIPPAWGYLICALVAMRAAGWPRLGGSGCGQDAGWCLAGLFGHYSQRTHGPRGRPEPDVFGGL